MNNQRNQYLRLKEDFFKQDKMAILENSKNGFLFSNILIKLYLLSLKNNGELLLSEDVPYTSEMLAQLTGHKKATIEQALSRFKELVLMKETENNSLSMTDFRLFSESITPEGERKRAYRNKKKLGQNEASVPTLSHKCPTEVPEMSQECPADVPDLSQTCHEAVPHKGEDCPTDVPDLSQICHEAVPHKGEDCPTDVAEIEHQPYSYSPPRSKKSGDEVPTFPKGRKLVKPQKIPIKKPEQATTQEPKPEEISTT